MEGFLEIRMRPWLRRLVTRSLALIPAVIVIIIAGDKGLYKLLILSQVILSLQLPFATIPLIHFTSDRKKMGSYANPSWTKVLSWVVAAIIVALNLKLVADELGSWISGGPVWLWLTVGMALAGAGGVLIYITLGPFFGRGQTWESGIAAAGQRVAERIRPKAIRHVGLALERASGDAEMISAALALLRSLDARVTLIHIVETPGTAVYGEESQSLHGTEDESYIEDLAREIEEHDLEVDTLLRFGSPVEELIKAVEEAKIDMLVLGSHGHRSLGDLIFGQTVHSVRHAVKIPVLVVRTGDGD
jgi:manganese transport protein